MSKPATERTYKLYTYDDVWNDITKKLNLTDEQLRKEVEKSLQMNAWSDIMDGIEYSLEFEKNPPPEFKELREEIHRTRESSSGS